MNRDTSAASSDAALEPLDVILARIGKRLKQSDIQRTDLRFGDLLQHLPSEYATLRAALTGLQGRESAPGVHECMAQVDALQAKLNRMTMEQQLAHGVRPALSSDVEVEMFALLMGWSDGRLYSHEEVALLRSSTVDAVRHCEARVREAVARCSLYCPLLLNTIEAMKREAPRSNGQITRFVNMHGYSKQHWRASTLVAAADLLGIDHDLQSVIIGGKERLSRLSQSFATERIESIARSLLANNREVTINDIVGIVRDTAGKDISHRDVRLAVAKMEGIKWIDSEFTAFRLREHSRPQR